MTYRDQGQFAGTSRAAVYALKNLGVKTIYLFNRTWSAAKEIVMFCNEKGVFFAVLCIMVIHMILDNLSMLLMIS